MSRIFLTATLFVAALCLAPAELRSQEFLPPGSPIEEGLGIDATEAGLNEILALAADFLPPDLVIGTIPTQELFSIPIVGYLVLPTPSRRTRPDAECAKTRPSLSESILCRAPIIWPNHDTACD